MIEQVNIPACISGVRSVKVHERNLYGFHWVLAQVIRNNNLFNIETKNQMIFKFVEDTKEV
jgi:hypothetical protein